MKNRHQALYMCFLYDRWLEPLIWKFVERVVDVVQNSAEKA